MGNIFSRMKELVPEALGGESIGRPIPEAQIPAYMEACRKTLVLMRPNLLPAEIRFLEEALPKYFMNCVGHQNAIITEDGETEHGYWRWRQSFWKEWQPVFLEVVKVRKIVTKNPDGWIGVWQDDLVLLKLFSDLQYMQGVIRKTPQQLYLVESWALDLESSLPKLLKQEGLESKVPLPKPPPRAHT